MSTSKDEDKVISSIKDHKTSHEIPLRKILRARTRLLVCFWTLPVYVFALWVLLSNGRNIDLFMFFYMAVWAGFAIDMSLRRCPKCNKQFYVKTILLNLISRRCVHCGLNERTEALKVESEEDKDHSEF